MIIDDDRNVLNGMKQVIPWEELGAEWAGEAMDGEAGLRLIRQIRPDLVITDIYMPVMSGLDMIEQLRLDDYEGKIVILSGYSDFEYARHAMRLNVVDYLTKPVSVPSLIKVLRTVFDKLVEEEAKRMERVELSEKLARYQPFIEKEWIKSAVSGTLDHAYRDNEPLPASCRSWRTARHAVVGIEMARDARLNEISIANLSLFRFAVSNIALELASNIFDSCEYVELHGTRSALAVHPGPRQSAEEFRMKLRQFGSELIDNVGRYLRIHLRVGLGGLKDEWRQIADSTEEAFRAIELREGIALKGYELYELAKPSEEARRSAISRPVKFYQELAGAVKAGQEGLAHRIIDEQTGVLERNGRLSPSEVQLLAGELWGVITYSLYEVGIVLDEWVPGGRDHREIGGLTRVDALGEWLKRTVSAICLKLECKGNSKHRQAVEFMLQYIHDNYADDVTLGDLADKVNISRNYLSDIFKKVTGETFNNYLTRVRMERAKELLLGKNRLVYEVAAEVGYKNVPYFSTLFKKYIGVNPTDLIR